MGDFTTTAERPVTERQMVILRAVQKFGTHEEAARQLGISAPAVRQAIAAIRTKTHFKLCEAANR